MPAKSTRRTRLDLAMVERGLAESRERAQALILAGEVSLNGGLARRPAAPVGPNDDVAVRASLRYVGRGGLKLEAALGAFDVPVAGAVVADVGASTGGFTDCLLQHGAARVYAIDVGYGQLHWRLRTDPRVVVLDRTNIRHLESLPEPVRGATVDVSFISLGLALEAVARLLEPGEPGGWVVALVKPQFEAGRGDVGKGGVVRDPATHRTVLARVAQAAGGLGLALRGLISSPLLGSAGNREFLAHLETDRPDRPASRPGLAGDMLDAAIERALADVPAAETRAAR